MSMGDVVGALVNGIAEGSMVFLIASGLTLIFGVMRVLTFAHGGFFMLGAYFAHSMASGRELGGWQFWLIVLVGALAVGVVGVVAELVLFRRLYALPEMYSLLGTYALLLILQGLATLIWGVGSVSLSLTPGLTGPVHIPGAGEFSRYSIYLAGVGIVVVLGLNALVNRTQFGSSLRAIAADRDMASILGINIRLVFAATFTIGVALAGLGGALAGPIYAITPDLAVSELIKAFAVVVVGGLGSIWGAYWVAIGLSTIDALMVSAYPSLAVFSFYAAMAIILVLRPRGILGKETQNA